LPGRSRRQVGPGQHHQRDNLDLPVQLRRRYRRKHQAERPDGSGRHDVPDTAYACATQYCEGTNGGLGQNTNCLEIHCINQFLPFFHPDPTTAQEFADDVCFDCIVENVDDPLETLAQGKTTCTTSTNPVFAYQGQTPLLILSKHKITKKSFYAYPSSGLRRGILKAQVELPGNLPIDFFCTQLISPQVEGSIPYVGPYGHDGITADGGTENGWYEEQQLQATRGSEWIVAEQKADNVPAIIAGTFYSTLPYGTGAGALENLSPNVMNTLQAAFIRAEPPGYVRVCDGCGTNPYTPGAPDLEFSPLFLLHYPGNAKAVVGESLWATENSLVLNAEPGQTLPIPDKAPLSVYYAHNTLLVRPPSSSQ
jgi:hypothetical protein